MNILAKSYIGSVDNETSSIPKVVCPFSIGIEIIIIRWPFAINKHCPFLTIVGRWPQLKPQKQKSNQMQLIFTLRPIQITFFVRRSKCQLILQVFLNLSTWFVYQLRFVNSSDNGLGSICLEHIVSSSLRILGTDYYYSILILIINIIIVERYEHRRHEWWHSLGYVVRNQQSIVRPKSIEYTQYALCISLHVYSMHSYNCIFIA